MILFVCRTDLMLKLLRGNKHIILRCHFKETVVGSCPCTVVQSISRGSLSTISVEMDWSGCKDAVH